MKPNTKHLCTTRPEHSIHKTTTRRLNHKHNLLLAQQGKCYYCNKQLSFCAATLDHLKPQTRGGKDTIANKVVCCKMCNLEKKDMDINQYIKYRACKQMFKK